MIGFQLDEEIIERMDNAIEKIESETGMKISVSNFIRKSIMEFLDEEEKK